MEDPQARQQFEENQRERDERMKTMDPLEKFQEMQAAIARASNLVASAFNAGIKLAGNERKDLKTAVGSEIDDESSPSNMASRLNENAVSFYKDNQPHKAIETFSEALDSLKITQKDGDSIVDPEIRVRILCNRALAHLQVGRHQEAESDCDAALDMQASKLEALRRRGKARMALGKFEEALEDFRLCKELMEDDNNCDLTFLAELKTLESDAVESVRMIESVANYEGIPVTVINAVEDSKARKSKNVVFVNDGQVPAVPPDDTQSLCESKRESTNLGSSKEEKHNDEARCDIKNDGCMKSVGKKIIHGDAKNVKPEKEESEKGSIVRLSTAAEYHQRTKSFYGDSQKHFEFVSRIQDGNLEKIFKPEGALDVDKLTLLINAASFGLTRDPSVSFRVCDPEP
uniref:Uncharacterized protein n=1 Tax=Lotharella globosa TaxID=91324 RepID=A0A7S3YEL9_9EUKA